MKATKKYILAVTIILGILIATMIILNNFKDKYGILKLCSLVGGIWCYWPPWSYIYDIIINLFVLFTFVLVISVIILLIKKHKLKNNKSG